ANHMNSRPVYSGLSIHWDHHPENSLQHYGSGTDAEQIRAYLRRVKPDVTQYHAIGCFGYASFPSEVAPVVPGLCGDPLKTWATVCAEEHVSFGCYAATFDCRSPGQVPEWRCVNHSGTVSSQYYCPNGPWTGDFLVPLLLEVMERYHPAHFWLDGVWLPAKREDYCYCEHCRSLFFKQYGHQMPSDPSAVDWIEIQEFHEQSLDNAISRISRTIKGNDPDIMLACNYLYFFKDVRKPRPDVDWLSWDALNTPNLHRASFESAYISTAGQPADIMIYEQGIVHWKPQLLRRPRTITQLKTEVATILAHGARVNLWHDPNPDGGIPPAKAELASQLAEFVRQRQNWCIDNNSVAEVVVLASRLDHLTDPQHQDKTVRAMQQLLQEAHIPCDIVHDDGMLNRLVQYHLVILPETTALNVDTAQWLHQYVMDGGSVLLIATELTGGDNRWLEILLGEDVKSIPTDFFGGQANWNGRTIELGHRRYQMTGSIRTVIPYTTGEAWLAELTLGDGIVLVICGEAATDYAETHWPPLRDLIASAARKALGKLPLVEMAGHPGIELVVNRRGSDLFVHLVNLTPGISFGAPSEVFFDEVPIYSNIALTVRPPQQPARITFMPDGVPLPHQVEALGSGEHANGCTLQIVVPELKHHVALRLENVYDSHE
ncbi:MAG TPA: alpha-amylase family protein, partial [Anaerolineae bacterium]